MPTPARDTLCVNALFGALGTFSDSKQTYVGLLATFDPEDQGNRVAYEDRRLPTPVFTSKAQADFYGEVQFDALDFPNLTAGTVVGIGIYVNDDITQQDGEAAQAAAAFFQCGVLLEDGPIEVADDDQVSFAYGDIIVSIGDMSL